MELYFRFTFKSIEIENKYFHRLVNNNNPFALIFNLCNLEWYTAITYNMSGSPASIIPMAPTLGLIESLPVRTGVFTKSNLPAAFAVADVRVWTCRHEKIWVSSSWLNSKTMISTNSIPGSDSGSQVTDKVLFGNAFQSLNLTGGERSPAIWSKKKKVLYTVKNDC